MLYCLPLFLLAAAAAFCYNAIMMKHLCQWLSFAALCFAPLLHAAEARPPATLPGGWVYSWGDEFNGSKLDTQKWNYELGVVRNQGASQTYTKKAVKLRGGKLIITTQAKETRCSTFSKQPKNWREEIRTQPYSSGSITTKGKYEFRPGCRLEVRAKLPSAKGSWPAIWMIHHNGRSWPACGETDLLEHITQETNTCYSTFHWGDGGSNAHRSGGSKKHIDGLCGGWHVYSLEWTRELMVIRVDEQEIVRLNVADVTYADGSNPFLHPAHLILNTAVGGEGTWPEKPDATQYPCRFEIDYVRCYTREDRGNR